MTKKSSLLLLCLAALLLGAGAAVLWWPRTTPAVTSDRSRERERVESGIVTTAHNSHQPAESYSKTGDARALPADPALTEALSHTSRLPYAHRLAAVHAVGRELASRSLTPDEAAFLRAFITDPAIPEGLDIRQVRALKNDLLNILCLVPGEESATAATLRALYADESADPGLRDYALQHLAGLAERDPSLGWSSHLHAIEGNNPALAATALINLAAQLRQPSPASDLPATRYPLLATISTAALRLASDPTAPAPARTTALQICGQLKLTEARDLAYDLARSEQAAMTLRIAAVATLGDLGATPETRAYLTTLISGPEKRLRVPAQSALQRLSIN